MSFQNERSPLVVDERSVPMHSETDYALPLQIRKGHLILVCVSMLFSGLVGHMLTSAYYSNQYNILSTESAVLDAPSFGSKSHHEQKNKMKNEVSQQAAFEQFQTNLSGPSYEAELFYNPTKHERKEHIMRSSQGAATPTPPPPKGCKAVVIIIRHCEKGSIREHCNAIGFQRANYIASLFGDDKESRWPAPDYLFALAPGERRNINVNNWREIETLQPLSKKIEVPIDYSFGMHTKQEFAMHIFNMLRTGEMCGKVAVVSWKHEDIPHLARSIGCGPNDGCPRKWASGNDFDSTWQVLYSYHKQMFPSFAIGGKDEHKPFGTHPQWWISGHVEKENFDPLEYGKDNGFFY